MFMVIIRTGTFVVHLSSRTSRFAPKREPVVATPKKKLL